ncbi:hypothetical protein F5984_25385 [Rudanella paleaurantiibacter]|uniref:Protein phosphatase 2C domain-containing protein n=1 Tax=Rudanella paleaurantiibacter TaxID=2614655 RepID=A0A7J5TSI2_9BACT|nr:hypothetical protein [Rudanella paleaurantiibacter]KAB7725993.1 hypothetical protein F5984_25385 [Rudanella paleaurantiibacter]
MVPVYLDANTSDPGWQSVWQSVAKPDGDYVPHNQDAAHPVRWFLSDGAGGTGFFAADWARHLCEHLPAKPFQTKEAVTEWFEKLRVPFFNAKRSEAAQSFSDILDDYDREGSSATLLAVWPIANKQIQVLHYGDSAAFLLDRQGHLKQRTTALIDFTEPPWLLHSNESLLPEHLHLNIWPVAEGDTLLLASDALAQWLLIQFTLREPALQPELDAVLATPYGLGNQIIYCQQQHEPALTLPDLLHHLAEMCATEAAFCTFTTNLYQRGQLALDDYTLRLCLRTPTS